MTIKHGHEAMVQILDFDLLNTVKQSKLLVKKILMGGILPNLTEIRKSSERKYLDHV